MSLKELRKAQGHTQKSLAQEAGISVRTIQRMESGTLTGSPYTLSVLSAALGVEIAELAGNSLPTHQDTLGGYHLLNRINLSALLGLLVPLGNLLLPVLLFYRYRYHSFIKEKGTRILSFQLLWLLVTVFLMIGCSGLLPLLFESLRGGAVPLYVPIYMLSAAGNIFMILQTAIRINSQKPILTYIPKIF